jgi:hypothetical protein
MGQEQASIGAQPDRQHHLLPARSGASSVGRPEPNSSPNARRNYERYLALARAEDLAGNTVGAENYYQHASTILGRCPPWLILPHTRACREDILRLYRARRSRTADCARRVAVDNVKLLPTFEVHHIHHLCSQHIRWITADIQIVRQM